MPSSSATGPDTVINLKVIHDGVIKKLKLPLRDLGASTLETKLRAILDLSDGTKCLIERYSDSAASYVVLDASNASVFKQLYRAAKAKQKLKLRVTNITPAETEARPEPETEPEQEQEPKVATLVPRPVTVEDVPEVIDAGSTLERIAIPPPPSTSTAEESVAPAAVPRVFKDLQDKLDARFTKEKMQSPAVGYDDHHISSLLRSHLATEPLPRGIHEPATRGMEQVYPDTAAIQTLLTRLQTKTSTAPVTTQQKADTTEVPKPAAAPAANQQPTVIRPPFAVYCNSCDKTIPDIHYHCSTCDDGDFDLCQACVDIGITCYGDDHWLIKRMVRNGVIVTSTTERKAPAKTIVERPATKRTDRIVPIPSAITPPTSTNTIKTSRSTRESGAEVPAFRSATVPLFRNYLYQNVRTCNNCVQEFPEHEFLHCTTCFDFDLCKSCFVKDSHGHHPRHGFVPAVEGAVTDNDVSCRLGPGRNQKHNAICDGCDKFIQGVRHKCLDCPDWDYCSDCVSNANFVHPNHRFVPIYEPIRDTGVRCAARPVHFGIHCDGPLCRSGGPRFITGDRYKCAVCHDTDFCANCEASPANTHNKTHPLLKFKTPVRNVNVVTTGEHGDGKKMPVMGDRLRRTPSISHSTEPAVQKQTIAPSSVQTVVDVQPVAPATPIKKVEVKAEEPAEKEVAVKQEVPVVQKAAEPAKVPSEKQPSTEGLVAVYERDTIADGTVMPPNHIFEQTWVLRNAGTEAWPAGCSVKYVGGDYMGHVSSNHPAGVKELVSASESTICYAPLAPGQTFSFTVLLRTPSRDGKVISYWRLTTPDNLKFGHRLWCDVVVKSPEQSDESQDKEVEAVAVKEEPKEETVSAETHESQMIFPKLEKESPVSSVHEAVDAESHESSTEADREAEDYEDCNEDDEWDESEDGFMTDEEYDILDASDEEYLEDEQKKQLK